MQKKRNSDSVNVLKTNAKEPQYKGKLDDLTERAYSFIDGILTSTLKKDDVVIYVHVQYGKKIASVCSYMKEDENIILLFNESLYRQQLVQKKSDSLPEIYITDPKKIARW